MRVVGFLQWLSSTAFSTILRESTWAEPIVETVHVLTLTLFLGFAVLLDYTFTLYGRVTSASDTQFSLAWRKLAALVSFFLWAGVGLAGRAIGYVGK